MSVIHEPPKLEDRVCVCHRCKGRGEIGIGLDLTSNCPDCQGTGQVLEERCSRCELPESPKHGLEACDCWDSQDRELEDVAELVLG